MAAKFRKIKPFNEGKKITEDEPDFFEEVSLTSDQLPELKDWNPGEEYLITYKVNMKTKEQIEKKPMRARFELKEVKDSTDEA